MRSVNRIQRVTPAASVRGLATTTLSELTFTQAPAIRGRPTMSDSTTAWRKFLIVRAEPRGGESLPYVLFTKVVGEAMRTRSYCVAASVVLMNVAVTLINRTDQSRAPDRVDSSTTTFRELSPRRLFVPPEIVNPRRYAL